MADKMEDARVEVSVKSQYIEQQSDPDAPRFAFAYTITIQNNSDRWCQLLNRHWVITDASGKVEEVQGEGVVGEQPKLNPGEAFRYTSGTILETPIGAMQGTYEFQEADGSLFDVPIPVFSLSQPHLVH